MMNPYDDKYYIAQFKKCESELLLTAVLHKPSSPLVEYVDCPMYTDDFEYIVISWNFKQRRFVKIKLLHPYKEIEL